MLTLIADGRSDAEVDVGRTMLTLIADGLNDAEIDAGANHANIDRRR